MKRIGIFTSGGDSPGMNAHIRAVARYAIEKGIEVIGIEDGYSGIIEGRFRRMDRASTANIISLGGTILLTSRSKEFRTVGGRAAAAARLKDAGIEGLVACGGD